jgi:hypothetical protein
MRAFLVAAIACAAPACSDLLDLQPPPPFTPEWSYHDDFETGDLAKWHIASSQNGAIGIATTGAHAGCCAMHATLDASGTGFQYGRVTWTDNAQHAAVTDGTLAVRAFVRADALDRDTRELSFSQGGDNATAFATAGLGANDSDTTWGFFVSDPAASGYSLQSSVPAAFSAWHCVEYVINVAHTGHVAIFVDDNPVPVIDGIADTIPPIGWDSVTVGLGFASGVTATDLELDDAAAAIYPDTSQGIHIGCSHDP